MILNLANFTYAKLVPAANRIDVVDADNDVIHTIAAGSEHAQGSAVGDTFEDFYDALLDGRYRLLEKVQIGGAIVEQQDFVLDRNTIGTIRQAIIDAIDERSTLIQSAYRTDSSKIDGYPAALVIPNESLADYHQTAPVSNKETYIFTIRILYPFAVDGQEEADIALERAYGELVQIFRDRNALSPAADWVMPVPSVWGYQQRGEGEARVAELKIQAVKYVE